MLDRNDAALLRLSKQGDVDAYGVIVARYERTVFSASFRILGVREDAEDASQETFVKAYQSLARFDLERSFGPWVRRIAVNLSLNMLRGSRPQEALEEERYVVEQTHVNPEALVMLSEDSARIQAGLIQLPDHYRTVVVLRHFQEMSYAEISEVLGLPLSTVKSNLFRARRLLAEKMMANGI